MDASPLPRVASIALLVVLLALLAGLATKAFFSLGTHAAMFGHPFQFDESEGMIVAETMLLDKGVNIYAPLTPDLFIAAPYPPLFYLLCWPFQHLLGDEPSFKIGRSISLLSTLVSGVAIFGVTVSLTKSKLGGAIGALAFWSLGLVTFWGSLVKPDMLAVALGLCGLWWLVLRHASSLPASVWWALPLFLAAFYTKQTSVAAGVAAVGWLLFTRPRLGAAFGAAYGAGAVVPSLLLNWATNGGYFYHEYTIHDLPWFPDRYVQFIFSFLTDYGALLLPGMLTIVVLGVEWLFRRARKQESILPKNAGLLLFFYFAMSIVVASGTGTLGGNHNHLLEWAAASCLGLGVGVGVVRGLKVWQWQGAAAILALLALVWVPSLFSVPTWLQLEFNQLKPERTEGLMNIFQYVVNNGGLAYSDNTGLMLATHKRLWTTDPFTQTHATYYKRWDQSKLVDAINNKRFSQIIFRIDVTQPLEAEGDVSPEILQAVRDNYKLDQHNVLNIYVPR